MCIIIHKPAAVTIPVDYLKEAADYNPDGVGVAIYAPGQKIRIIKSERGKPELAIQAQKNNPGAEIFFHFRVATHGEVCDVNTHPINIPGTPFWLMHNGILHGFGESIHSYNYTKPEKKKEKNAAPTVSDTRDFCETILSPMLKAYPGLVELPAFVRLFREAAGSGSKFALLGPTNGVILNRSAGVERDGAWYSNHTAFPVAKVKGGYAGADSYGLYDDDYDRAGFGGWRPNVKPTTAATSAPMTNTQPPKVSAYKGTAGDGVPLQVMDTKTGRYRWLTRKERREIKREMQEREDSDKRRAAMETTCAFAGGNCGCEDVCDLDRREAEERYRRTYGVRGASTAALAREDDDRLRDLIQREHAARAEGRELSLTEQAELATLVHAAGLAH